MLAHEKDAHQGRWGDLIDGRRRVTHLPLETLWHHPSPHDDSPALLISPRTTTTNSTCVTHLPDFRRGGHQAKHDALCVLVKHDVLHGATLYVTQEVRVHHLAFGVGSGRDIEGILGEGQCCHTSGSECRVGQVRNARPLVHFQRAARALVYSSRRAHRMRSGGHGNTQTVQYLHSWGPIMAQPIGIAGHPENECSHPNLNLAQRAPTSCMRALCSADESRAPPTR